MSELPLRRLESWMRDHIEGSRGPLAAEQFEGGQSNPTYKLVYRAPAPMCCGASRRDSCCRTIDDQKPDNGARLSRNPTKNFS
jgi:aminoglycoside phosphotransferase (APT) family kinase protein